MILVFIIFSVMFMLLALVDLVLFYLVIHFYNKLSKYVTENKFISKEEE